MRHRPVPRKPGVLAAKVHAALWTSIVLVIAGHQVQFWRAARLDTDVLALLPEDEQMPAIRAATRKLADQASRQVAVLVGAPTWDAARRAGTAVAAELERAHVVVPARSGVDNFDAAVAFYRAWRDRLLTAPQRAWLEQATPEDLATSALMRLYQPVGGPQLTDRSHDPLGLWPSWWAARLAETRARPRDGRLWLEAGGRDWVLLNYVGREGAFAVSGDTPLGSALARARRAARAVAPDSRVLAAGVPLHAEAAAAQAVREVSLIGYGSLAAVLLLVWLTFRSLRPLFLVALSLVVGCAAALSVTALLFERVHLLTLVFGASLVGVAEDYGFHYFAARQGRPPAERGAVMHHVLPGLGLALLTSAVAYLALGLAPFPGLRQMAVFSVVGLVAAFLTVLCWFPVLDQGALPTTPFAARVATSLVRWPRWRPRGVGLGLAVVLGALTLGGLGQLQRRDDVRQLQSSPAALMVEQTEMGRLLGLPSPAQFYLVEGADADEIAMREEALRVRLDRLVAGGTLPGYRALSDWRPSAERQRANSSLTDRAERGALSAIAGVTGEVMARPTFAPAPLGLRQLLDSPVAAAITGLWLGELDGRHYSVLLLRGLTPSMLPALADAGRDLPGVRWVNKTAEFSALLARYRVGMGWLLLVGYGAVYFALALRFGAAAWRALLPTALGSLATLAVFGWLGLPLQLFVVLALVLLLGMGVDYGIFLLEHPGDGSAWLAVALAGVSTLLSFGLLALSATPALHAFGLTMLIGEGAIWLLTPCFRLPSLSDRVQPT